MTAGLLPREGRIRKPVVEMDKPEGVRRLSDDELRPPQPSSDGRVIMTDMLSVRISWLNAAIEHQTANILDRLAGLNLLEWRCLLTLCTRGPKTGSELAELCNVSRPQASRGMRALGAKGLIAWPGGSERRYFGPASATEAGWEVYRQIAPVTRRRNDWLMSDLSAEDRDTLFRLVATIRRRVGQGDDIDHLLG